MNIGLKIKELRKEKKLTLNDLSEQINVDSSQLSKIERGLLKPTINQIKEISSFFNTSTDVLLSDVTDDSVAQQLKESKERILRSKKTEKRTTNKLIPLIPIEAMAGYGNGEAQVNEADITEGYMIPDFDEKGVKYLIRVSGSSMYPKYSNGDLLGCKPIKDLSFFQWGKCYVLDTDQGPLVKRLFEVTNEPDMLLCVSENNERYPPFKIHRNSVYRTAIIVGVLRLE